MKLRNKKTGEHGEYQVISAGDLIRVRNCDTNESYQYDCISGFNDNWEDYEPVEPIFDEKIRRGIRAWWDMQDNPFEKAAVMLKSMMADRDGFYHWKIFGYIRSGEEKMSTDMEFRTKKLYAYKPHHDYTKEELCGEEMEG